MKRVAAIMVVVCAILVPMGAVAQIGGFSPSLFRFNTEIADDGTGAAGGWQTAYAVLKFHGIRRGLECPVKVGMPIRSSVHGRISQALAADVSAEVATLSSSVTRRLRPRWLGEDFCIAWRENMETIFRRRGFAATASRR
jgi:hypothetical protein